jgi:hypothetical protein
VREWKQEDADQCERANPLVQMVFWVTKKQKPRDVIENKNNVMKVKPSDLGFCESM